MEKGPDVCRLKAGRSDSEVLNVHRVNVSCLHPDEQGGHFLQADPSRKTPWSEQETRTLLEIWGEDPVQLTLKGSQKNRHVFEYISEKMSNRGYTRTTDQCYSRIKRLKYGFLHEK